MTEFVTAMTLNVPLEVKVESCTRVINTFEKQPGAEDPVPLFEIEIIIDDDDFAFTWDSEKVVHMCNEVFSEGVKVTQDIEQLDRRLLKKIYKNTGISMKLKSPVLPDKEPHKPTPQELAKGKLPDYNEWLW